MEPDSPIRLDMLMPVAPLTENNVNRITGNDVLNQSPDQTIVDSTAVNLVEVPDLIDLTGPTGEIFPPNLNRDRTMDTRSIPLTCPPVIFIDEDNCVPSSINRSLTKHKLPPLNNHSLSKVSRTDSYDSVLSTVDSNGNEQISFLPTPNQEGSGPIIPQSSVMKNHTVTSDSLQLDLCGQLLVGQGPDHFPNDVIHNFHQQMEGNYIATNCIQQKYQQVDINLGSRLYKGKEPEMFYQLLDMFPDIDLNFLKSQCHLGLEVNQVSEVILEMKDYPKEKSQTPFEKKQIPEVVVNMNLNIPPSCSSSTGHILAGEEKFMSEKNRSNFGLTWFNLPATSSHVNIVSPPTYVNCDPVNKISGNGKDDNDNISSSSISNSQETSKEVIVDELKRNKDKAQNNSSNRPSGNTNSTQSQFSFLMEVFPDADPTFMELKSKLKDNDLRNFIAEGMEKHDYPKIATSVKCDNEVGDETIEIGLYTTKFNIENFIKIFPDPFGYFLDEKRNCHFTEHGFGFLKRRYRWHAIKLISSKYRDFKYNLVKTSEFLDIEKPSRLSKRSLSEIKMPDGTNLPFLQEACFIEHRTEIKSYLDGVAEAKKLLYDQAEGRGELIECGCCYQNVIFEDCAPCNEGHLFCKTCVQKSVEVRIGDAHTTFPCLQECDSVFSLKWLEVLVDATMFSRLLQRIQLEEVRAADIEGLEVCPFCDFAVILPPETSIFKCLNPECLKESCRKCHRLSHIPQRCEEVENDDQARARKYIEDEMTRALVRVCYKCKRSFIKTDGCNKMTCQCGARMCYICRKPIVDYKHFNGPGGEEKQKCPLYSTEKLLHVDAVEAVAKKALEEVTSKNPELKLKHDPSKILPHASSAQTMLPPGVNEEADRLMNLLQNLHQQVERIQQARQDNNHLIVLPAPPHRQVHPQWE